MLATSDPQHGLRAAEDEAIVQSTRRQPGRPCRGSKGCRCHRNRRHPPRFVDGEPHGAGVASSWRMSSQREQGARSARCEWLMKQSSRGNPPGSSEAERITGASLSNGLGKQDVHFPRGTSLPHIAGHPYFLEAKVGSATNAKRGGQLTFAFWRSRLLQSGPVVQ